MQYVRHHNIYVGGPAEQIHLVHDVVNLISSRILQEYASRAHSMYCQTLGSFLAQTRSVRITVVGTQILVCYDAMICIFKWHSLDLHYYRQSLRTGISNL
jgi:hypothetical protein